MIALSLLLACEIPPPPPPKDPLPDAPGDYWRDASGEILYTYGDNLVRSGSEHRLYIVAGEETETGYRATALAEYRLESEWYEKTGWKLGAPCTGEVVLDDHTLHITTGGSETCDALAGRYTSAPKGPPSTGVPKVAGAPACQAYTDCVCGLSDTWTLKVGLGANNPFREGCESAKSLLIRGVAGEGECAAGRSIMRSLAQESGMSLPAACSD